MSLWPRLRRRSRGRKRSSSKPNPYSNIGLDKLAVVHAEFDAQRALFAAEKGVPVSVVRFISGSQRGWTLLPTSAVGPAPADADHYSSTSSSGLSSPDWVSAPFPARSRPRALKLPSPDTSASEGAPGGSGTFQFSPPESPSPAEIEAFASSPSPSPSSSPASANAGRADSSELRNSNVEGSLIPAEEYLSRNPQAAHTASVLFVSLGVFSSAVGFGTAFALILSSWRRGSSTLKRIFSILATHLVSAIRPSLLVKGSRNSLSGKSASLAEEEEEAAAEAEMKVTPAAPIAPIFSKETGDAEVARISSFAFPVLPQNNSVGTPIFRGPPESHALVAAPELNPIVTSIKVVAVSSQPGSPAFDASKGAPKPCQKLKARIFKCHPPRKVTPATSENSSTEEDGQETVLEVDPAMGAHNGLTDSPRDSPRCKRLSFIRRRAKSKKGLESDEQSGLSAESEFEDVSSPVTRVVAVRASRSQEILASRNPNSDAAAPSSRLKVSRSQELKQSLRNLKHKIKSHELAAPSAANAPEMPLESAAVDLHKMAFPFKHDADSSNCSSPTTLGPNSSSKAEKRRGSSKCLLRKLSNESDKSGELGPASPRSTTISQTSTKLSKCMTAQPSRMTTERTSTIDCKPELRKVKTTVARMPLPADHGELARSPVLDRETLGALLVLAVLGFLLLGRIPAILGTACLCLVLSHVQKFLSHNLTPREKERLASKSGVGAGVGLSRLGGSSPPNSLGQGNPVVDVQSSEYRKKVLLEGFLDRGNRRN
ncbi:hypothetical protein MPTK1_1g13950 [Marchantia polymorpha subsp. ruderalis]|uniref:Uncharacterized protein n=2 Tax=Marchantia polymorpha TaxID=3197 RepID=A0AAF6APX0_MARPO|nr:hypothetical protein MARPO_0019s0165 [Marchantia polymorpha]BBM98490.1 hypothetical protein Mp_1g13950 [Marchantia polymorpha subsp. ruderalis]|eukprot:PTQ44761.1 hypothetical protein MARPO_0019s0165 [Marchantia polymorpha]